MGDTMNEHDREQLAERVAELIADRKINGYDPDADEIVDVLLAVRGSDGRPLLYPAAQLDEVRQVIGLLRSMVLAGEKMDAQVEEAVDNALARLRLLEER